MRLLDSAQISIHAPTNGATIFIFLCSKCIKYFNPRSDERSDSSCVPPISTDCDFNPRSDERSDPINAPVSGQAYDFNPRSDERSDSRPYLFQPWHTYFNPRSDERSDHDVLLSSRCFTYFNPRSDERSDSQKLLSYIYSTYFNPRSDERSDCNFAQKNEKTIQNRLIILLFSTNSLRLLCSCIQYSFFLFIFHGANDLVILCSLSFRTTSKN